MKKIIAMISAVLIAATAFAAVPANAAVVNEAVLKYTPTLDGRLDAAYLQSLYINHEWPAERSSANYWGNGRFEFVDMEKNPDGTWVEGSVGYNTSYGWDLQASTYFLWDDDFLYIAVNVIDDDYGCIDDAHYAMAAADTGNWGPWLQDSICVGLTYKGMHFDIRADRAGRYATVFREPNYGHQVWCDMYSWIEHTKNKDAGYFATAETGSGYLIELKVPVSESVKAKILKDGGNFKFGISVIDGGANSPYALDEALKAEGIEQEGYQLQDFMLHNDCLNAVDGKPDQKIKLVDQAPDTSLFEEVEDSLPGGNVVNNEGGNSGNTGNTVNAGTNAGSTSTDPSAPTGDIGIAVAAVALAAGACFVVIRRKKN